ncbi:fimbrial protein [Pantoea sp. 1.19]|uniref:fimbrial protein n=1 Tax=Pantoea sp. 1.19 TaxID=1925589 RepID=UPI00094896B4|nr:fimbrial protein [Pantoea sp. 1.19]
MILFSAPGQAFTCRVVGGGAIGPGGSLRPVDVSVHLGPVISQGRNLVVNMQQVTCTNDVSSWKDFLTLDGSLALSPTYFSGINAEFNINGSVNNNVTGYEVMSATQRETLPINIVASIILDKNPHRDIVIHQGDVLAQFNFMQSNDQPGCPNCGPYRWRIVAGNDAYYVTTSCTINEGEKMLVNFNDVNPRLINSDPQGSAYQQLQPLRYYCEGSSATQDIEIRLIGTGANFSSRYIATSNPTLGIAMLYNNAVVAPGETFATRIVGGSGSDNVTFALVKAPGSTLQAGPFTGSATLIVSAP